MAESVAKTPWHLWVLGFVSLLWNAYGCYDVYMFRTGAYDYQMRARTIAYFQAMPDWAWGAWAICFGAGLLGALLLLLRSKWAFHAFVVSFAASTLYSIYLLVLTNGGEAMGGYIGLLIFNVLIAAIGIFFIFYTRSATKRGFLR
jgi:hypothetical protein